MNLYDHIYGGLLGQALGDAWAMPADLRPHLTWERYGGWIDTFLEPPQEHPVHGGLPAGRVTDDTEQAIALAESIIAEGRITVEGAARAIVGWYDRIGGDNVPFVGPSTGRAVRALKAGADPRSTGREGTTNGGAMRVSPIGLINPGNIEQAVADAAIACTPTHFTDVAISGAAAVAAAVSRALTPGASLDDLIEAGIQGAELGLTYGATSFGASVRRRIEVAVEIARRDGDARERIRELYDVVGSTLATTEAVPAAFGILVMGDGDPVQCAIYGAALSGDADTVAAMACAIAGAWRGAGAIPSSFIETLIAANPELDFEGAATGLFRIAEQNAA
jgi:ADP-ribosylglycohydrolase